MESKEEKLERLLKELDDVESHIFLIDMIDRWQDEDEKAWNRLQERRRQIEKEIEEIENEG